MKTKAPRSNPIRILTQFNAYNYGSQLQAYALCRYLIDAEYAPQQINYGSWGYDYIRKMLDAASEHGEAFRDGIAARVKAFDRFTELIPQSAVYTAETIGAQVGKDDIYIAGSDQIWNPCVCNSAFLLDFVPEHNGKISYAASIGWSEAPKDFLEKIAESINRFDAVSVREAQGRDLLKPYIGQEISVVPDPTLLLTRGEWESVAVPSPIAEPYIFVYLLGENPEHRKAIRDVAAKTGLKVVTLPHTQFKYRNVDEGFGDYPLYGVGPAEFLGLLAGARAVVTDSFHGSVFSIIFEKSFCTLEHHKDTEPGNTNPRFYTLFESLGIEGKFIKGKKDIASALLGPIDYVKVGERLKGLRAAGDDFLFGSIERAAKRMAESEPYLARSRCSGCTACYAACPVGAITMRRDDEGFAYPLIDAAKCVDCGICSRVCDSLDTPRTETRCAYAAYALDDDFRAKSSSGGIAALLAERTVRRGGVVYGAAFDENLAVRHVEVDDIEGLDRLRGSKYVQSDVGDTYASAKKHLDAGREVLYTGTACQVAGLKAFLKKDYPNLTTLDVICHGTPSPKVWEAYVAMMAEKHGSPIESVSFRSKIVPWRKYSMLVSFKDGSKYLGNHKEDPYFCGFLKSIYLRPSCHSCRFKGNHRPSDITTGDFWSIQNILPEMDDNRGTSLVVANTPKGQTLVDELSGQLRIAEVDASQIVKYNSTLAYSSVTNPHSARFFYELNAGEIGTEALLYKYTYMPLPAKASPKAIDYSGVSYARIDIKNAGADTNDVDVLEISDPEAKVDAPAWLCRQGGRGRVIKSTAGKLSLKLKCTGAGKLRLTLRGPDFRGPDKKPRIPVWVSYTKLVVDGKTVFKGVKPVWHDAPFNYPMDVKDGQIVVVSVEWDASSLDVGSGMGQVIATSGKANKRANDLSTKLKAVPASKGFDIHTVSYARIDVKNAGADTNDVDVLEISDPEAKVDAPAWLCRQGGRGRVIKSTAGKLSLKLKCTGAGKLRLTLRGPDFRGPDKKTRIPVWVSYTKLVVDSKTVFKGVKPVWHDAPFNYPMDVKDGQIVTVSVEWDASSLDVGSGMEQVIAASQKANKRADDLAAKLVKAEGELVPLRRRVKALTVDVSDFNAQMEDLEATYSDRLKLVSDAKDSLARRLKRAESVNASLQSQLDDVRSGLSFRIGRLITWLPRKLTGRN